MNTDRGLHYVPPSFLLQWHVNERCNLRCAHCYQENSGISELSFAQLQQVYCQFLDLLEGWQKLRQRQSSPVQPVRAHITLTGGEPLLRADFADLLAVLRTNPHISLAVLTNGTLIDIAWARLFRQHRLAFVQISIEGLQQTHDAIRGPGSFARAVEAVRLLRREGVPVMLSFTAHRLNFREFPAVAELGARLGVWRVWADRLIPQGQGATLHDLLLTPAETRHFFLLMRQARAAGKRRYFNRTQVAMQRALQFRVGGGRPYHCTAGDTLLTVQANGDLYPCRRLPIRVGNLLQTPLAQLYHTSEPLQRLRDRRNISADCAGCIYASLCRGGLRCLAYACTGDPFARDPGCWGCQRASEEVEFGC